MLFLFLASLTALAAEPATESSADGICDIRYRISETRPTRVRVDCTASLDLDELEQAARAQMDFSMPPDMQYMIGQRMELRLEFDHVPDQTSLPWQVRVAPIIRFEPRYPPALYRSGHAAVCSISFGVVDRRVRGCFVCEATGSKDEFESLVSPTLSRWIYTSAPPAEGLATGLEWSRPDGDALPDAPETPACRSGE